MSLSTPGVASVVAAVRDPRRKCGTCDWLAERTPHELATYREMAEAAMDPGNKFSQGHLLDEMHGSGYPYQAGALNKHLRGRSCVTE